MSASAAGDQPLGVADAVLLERDEAPRLMALRPLTSRAETTTLVVVTAPRERVVARYDGALRSLRACAADQGTTVTLIHD